MIDDSLFAREKKSKKQSADEILASAGKTSTGAVLSEPRKLAQETVDAALIANIQIVDKLEAYLKSKFTLKNGDKPHLLKF